MSQVALLDEQLTAILTGKAQPADAPHRIALAELCNMSHRRLHACAVQFYAEAIAAEPVLADDPSAGHRYNAACCAALAASGRAKDAEKADEKQRAGWRKQALDWLRADLKGWTALFERNPRTKEATAKTIAKTLAHWQTDLDLAGVRDEAALKKLPPDELPAWRQLWADVTALQKRAQQPTDVKPPK